MVTLGSKYNPSVTASPCHLPLHKGGKPLRLTAFGTSPFRGGLKSAAEAFRIPSVILRSKATKNPVNRTPSVTIRDPSLTLRMTAFFRQFIQQKKEMYIPFGIYISFFIYLSAFFFLLTVAVVITAAADRVNRAAHRAKLLSSPEGTLVRTGISVFSV